MPEITLVWFSITDLVNLALLRLKLNAENAYSADNKFGSNNRLKELKKRFTEV